MRAFESYLKRYYIARVPDRDFPLRERSTVRPPVRSFVPPLSFAFPLRSPIAAHGYTCLYQVRGAPACIYAGMCVHVCVRMRERVARVRGKGNQRAA